MNSAPFDLRFAVIATAWDAAWTFRRRPSYLAGDAQRIAESYLRDRGPTVAARLLDRAGSQPSRRAPPARLAAAIAEGLERGTLVVEAFGGASPAGSGRRFGEWLPVQVPPGRYCQIALSRRLSDGDLMRIREPQQAEKLMGVLCEAPTGLVRLRRVLADYEPSPAGAGWTDVQVKALGARLLASGVLNLFTQSALRKGREEAETGPKPRRIVVPGLKKPPADPTHWIEIVLKDEDGEPVSNVAYRLTLADGKVVDGKLDAEGKARHEGVPAGSGKVSFPEIDAREWRAA